MTMGERYVWTADISRATRGCETDVLDGLNIPWRAGRPHVTCPYPGHSDNNPSWRWDPRKARAYCTCRARGHKVLAVIMNVEGVDFETAKIRAAELLGRRDLIRERRCKKRGARGTILSDQHCNPAPLLAGCTLGAYAGAKRLPVGLLSSLGIREITYLGSPALRIPYFGAAGEEPAIRFRIALDGLDRFRWKKGAKPRLYGLQKLAEARTAGSIAIVEGESDCHVLWHASFPAIGLPGASNWNEERDASLFEGIAIIYLVIEPDRGGEAALRWLAKSRIRDRVRLVRINGFKDVSALYLDDPQRFAERWPTALDAAESFVAVADREAAVKGQQAENAAGDLILESDIVDRFAKEIKHAGLAGEARNAKVLYLVLITRLFDRPVNVVVKGPSAAGKNFIVKIILRFFPTEAYWSRTAMSDRTLAYSEEDFRHRYLVLYEATGMTSDIATYLIRTLLSEGCIEYEVVEKTKDGMRPRVIKKEGPTGLITTTTAARLHPENETRLLSLTVADTPAQTRAVMLAQADDAEDDGVDYERWHAYQRWLALGERRVVVPFAKRLAKEIPTLSVRLRRDFPMLLSLVRANALLHRELRPRDEIGRIIATPADYRTVRELISDLFSEGIEAGVATTVRETVRAVQQLGKNEASLAEIVTALGLDKSTASRRVKVAISKGYLVNEETGKGKRARIALGDPLPDDAEILPHPERLTDRCTVAASQAGIDTPSSADCDAELAEIEI